MIVRQKSYQILQHLQTIGKKPMTGKEIAESMLTAGIETSTRSVCGQTRNLIENGLLEKIAEPKQTAKYVITDKGLTYTLA